MDHPFAKHTNVYHELTSDALFDIHDQMLELKTEAMENKFPLEKSLLIIDDFADTLKDKAIEETLKSILIKSRHLGLCTIITLQAYNLMPLKLRKIVSNITLFKPQNNMEMILIVKELLNMPYKKAQELFNYIFDKPYMHLDIDTKTMKYYKNFNVLEF